jgi:hypothetical protein
MAWRSKKTWGPLLLGIWLIASGILPMVNIRIPWSGVILSGLAVAAGICILLER